MNQVIKDWDGHSPPLLSNFFGIALKKPKFSKDYYSQQIQEVYDYIEERFKKTKDDLANSPFDLELCFTLLEREIKRAIRDDTMTELRRLVDIRTHLKAFLAEVLSDFEYFAVTSHTMRNLGRAILYERPTIISFNYDCLMESVLEFAYGVNSSIPKSFREYKPFEEGEVPDDMLIYSHSNWNTPLGYGFRFDEVQLQQAGVSKFVKGSRFYSLPQNQLYSKPLLKLHGSLNWFRYLPVRSSPVPLKLEPDVDDLHSFLSQIILKRGSWWFNRPPDHSGLFIEPIIITPVLYKDEYYDSKPFREIWELAKQALSKCEKLVVIGYSFSPTDFSTKHLLIESLMNNDLGEVIVVDPNHELVRITKDLCHYDRGVVWYSSLGDYLNSFSESIQLESEPEKIAKEDLPKDTSPHDLYTKCKACGIEFPVGIRTNPRSFATSQYIANFHTCPNDHTASYDKDDYILKRRERAREV